MGNPGSATDTRRRSKNNLQKYLYQCASKAQSSKTNKMIHSDICTIEVLGTDVLKLVFDDIFNYSHAKSLTYKKSD